jgi:hypothetical protein
LIFYDFLEKIETWHAPRKKRIILPPKATFFEARFRDGYPEPRFTFWRPDAWRTGEKPPAANVRCPLESLLLETHRQDRGRAQSGEPHGGQGFVPPKAWNAVQARFLAATALSGWFSPGECDRQYIHIIKKNRFSRGCVQNPVRLSEAFRERSKDLYRPSRLWGREKKRGGALQIIKP